MTRCFGTPTGDVFLCEPHKDERLARKEPLGVPASAGAFMFGMKPWPTGKEPCVDCAKEVRKGKRTRLCDGCGKRKPTKRYEMVAYPGVAIRRWCRDCAKGAEHCEVRSTKGGV